MKPQPKNMSKTDKGSTRRKKKELSRATLDNLLEGCQIIGDDWRYLYLNATAEAHNRRPNQELLGNIYMEMWPGAESTQGFAEIKRCMEERVPIQLEDRFMYPDGEIGWFKLSLQPVPEGVLILSIDITEYKKAENQTIQMNRLYATLSQINQMVVRTTNREDLYQSICDIAVQFGGFSLAWIGLLDEPSGEIRPVVANGFDVRQWPFPKVHVHRGKLKKGQAATAVRTARVVTSEDIQTDQRTQALQAQILDNGYQSSAAVPFQLGGKTIGAVILVSKEKGFFKAEAEVHLLEEMALDISFALDTIEAEARRKAAEQALIESEERFAKAFYQSPIGIVLIDLTDFTIRDINDSLLGMTGFAREEVINKSSLLLNLQVDPEVRAAIVQELQEYGVYRNKEMQLGLPSGELRYVLYSGSRVMIDGRPHNLALIQDITERKRTEEMLRESEQKFSTLFEKSPLASSLSKLPDGVIVNINEAFERAFGYTHQEVIGRTSLELGINPDAEGRARLLASLNADGSARNQELELHTKSGEARIFSVNIDLVNIGVQKYILNTSQDITEQKLAEAQVGYQARLLENVHDAVLATDAQFNLTSWNQSAEAMYGYKAEEVLGREAREFIRSDFSNEQRAAAIQALQEGGSYRTEVLQYHRDGHSFWVEGSTFTLKETNGEIYGYVSINRDITQRKQAEERLILSEIRYRRLFESAKDGILIIDAETGMIVGANPFLITLLGYSEETFLGKKIWELGFFKDILANQANFLELQENEYIRYEDLPLESASGQLIDVEFVSNVYEVDHQKVIQCNIRDITERKQAAERIQRQLKHLNALRLIDTAISSSFDLQVILEVVLQQVLAQLEVDASAILLLDPELQILEYASSRGFLSDALQRTRLKLGEGYASQAVLARRTIHISALMETGGTLAKSLQLAHEEFQDYYGTPLIVKGEVKGVLEIYHHSHLKADPEWLDFLETLAGQAAIAIDNAQLFETLQRTNLSLEHRVAERTAELNRTNTELERANRAKDDFLANMSHELRTPLTSILGLSESLLEQRRDPLSEHQQKSIEIIGSSGQHLLELINDILDLSKIEAGKFDYYPQPVVIDDICRSSLAFIKAQATKKSIVVTYRNEATLTRIFADPRRLKQILVNLLTNAVKFTPEQGEVILEVQSELEQDLIQFSVIDNGIGIAPEDLARLFQPFVQVDSSLNRQYEGTGLGLALSQKLTDLHGGSIQVQSEVGKGSRFTVNLACQLAELSRLESLEAQASPTVHEQTSKTRGPSDAHMHQEVVLLAEDNMANILTIGEYLKSYGYQVVVAHDGSEAIKLAQEINPDIILMDIQMPILNGLEAIAQLRGSLQFADTPIIALTALAMPGDRERSLLAGATQYMSKPVSLKTLREEIENLVQDQSGE